MKHSVLLLSGGVDSLVLLARECHAGRPPVCVSFDYGQRHVRELEAARDIAHVYHVPISVLPLPRLGGSALTGDGEIPKGLHFADARQAATVVPNRNMVMLSVAASVATATGHDRVLFAAHAGDRAVYQDCRAEFVQALNAATLLACGVGVEAPFLSMSKREIVLLGRSLDVPFAVAWSCYEGGKSPCGKCGACVERTEAES
jgi:7-cyano-7-deazaguanine synthase